jgi:hypothetical protein
MNRRGFLGSILAAGYAPAAIGSGVLMPVRKVWVPEQHFVHRVEAQADDGIVIAFYVMAPDYALGDRVSVQTGGFIAAGRIVSLEHRFT